jgi:hypothetical protein
VFDGEIELAARTTQVKIGVTPGVEFSILWPIISPICHSPPSLHRTVTL